MILVTGASGTVGREVAARLSGHAPGRLGLRDPARAGTADGVRFDFLDPSSFGPALRGVDRVFLLRPPQLARPRHDFGPFVAAMERAGVRQVVFLSVRGAGSNPLLPAPRDRAVAGTLGAGLDAPAPERLHAELRHRAQGRHPGPW